MGNVRNKKKKNEIKIRKGKEKVENVERKI